MSREAYKYKRKAISAAKQLFYPQSVILRLQAATTESEIQQRLVALIALLVGILMPIVNDWDFTLSIVMIPIGLFFLFTKRRIIR